jgi:hypothetical protein
MKLVANIQLTPTRDEAKLLRQTLEACNAACIAMRRLSWGLTAQAAIRSIAKVADAYKAAKDYIRSTCSAGT